MRSSPRVVVVGGGITGCAVAYALALEGARVLVLEGEAIGSKASGVAAGLLLPLGESERPGPFLSLALESFHLHRTFTPEVGRRSGVDPHLVAQPVLYPAFDAQEVAALEEHARWQESVGAGLRAAVVDGAEARRLEPRLSSEAVAALVSYDEAHVDAYRLVLALARAAEGLGAEFRYAEATGLRTRGGRVASVRHARGEEPCDLVALCMGPWTVRAGEWLGAPLPVEPLRGQLLRLEVPGPPLQTVVFHEGGYVVHKPSGTTLAGTTEERAGFAPWPTEEGRRQIMTAALRLVPSLAEAGVAGAVAGLRPISPDGLPILGRVPGWDNALVATGAGRNGVLLAPITARAMADLALEREPSVRLGPFDPARFLG